MCYSERTTGKTTFFQCLSIYQWHKLNKSTVYVKRVAQRITKSQMITMFGVTKQHIPKLTDGVYNDVIYRSQRFYLVNKNEKGEIVMEASEPFMHIMALNVQDDTKSVFNDNDVTLVWFEEFITRERYLFDEFLKFQALISTVVRLRDDVLVAMTANTVNQFCPYFNEMGLTNVRNQKQGTIDIYTYGDSGLRVAVEYTAELEKSGKKKPSNIYFAFDNPRLEMVKTGAWEIASYPHLPWKSSEDTLLIGDVWFEFNDIMLQCDIRYSDTRRMVYMRVWNPHIDSEDFKVKPNTVVFTNKTPKSGHYSKYFQCGCEIVLQLLREDRVFYSDNMTGEVLNNWLKEKSAHNMIRG